MEGTLFDWQSKFIDPNVDLGQEACKIACEALTLVAQIKGNYPNNPMSPKIISEMTTVIRAHHRPKEPGVKEAIDYLNGFTKVLSGSVTDFRDTCNWADLPFDALVVLKEALSQLLHVLPGNEPLTEAVIQQMIEIILEESFSKRPLVAWRLSETPSAIEDAVQYLRSFLSAE